MLNSVNLRKTGTGWEFESEAALEDFAWDNLKQLLGLTPLKRQYWVKGQICDILATDENKRLVVLELKNCEDRYIVQQLTRYYDALLEEKPLKEEIDYSKPIRLVAITPSFHKDNLTDRKHHALSFQFLDFKIVSSNEKFYLYLKDIDTEKALQLEIPYQKREEPENIPNPPRTLINILRKCTEDEQKGFLQLRAKLLCFDRRVKEIPESGYIKYGRGKTKPIAEVRFDPQRNSLALFIWLPFVSVHGNKKFIARMRVWTNYEIVTDVGYVKESLGRILTETEWKLGTVTPLAKLLPPSNSSRREAYLKDEAYKEIWIRINGDVKKSYWSGSLAIPIAKYYKITGRVEKSNSLYTLVDIALEKWVEKL
jgi:RecB family endonuclease NucS